MTEGVLSDILFCIIRSQIITEAIMMTELQLILMVPAIACTTVGGILLGIDKLSRTEERKRQLRRAQRRRRRDA